MARLLAALGSRMTNDAAGNFLRLWVREKTGHECRDSDDLFDDCGLDSLDFAELVEDLDLKLSLELDLNAISEWGDVRTIPGFVQKLKHKGTTDQ